MDLGRWDPLTPAAVVDLLHGLDRPWWAAGGWAIDLHVGRQTREHADTDVLVLREDLLAVQHHLDGWDLHAADPPGSLCPWVPDEVLPAGVHDLWCRRTPTSPTSAVQLLQKSGRPRAKDEADLVAALPHLDDARRAWLASSLTTVTPGHPWLALLQRGQDGS